jgi:pre-mRNA-splicing factor ATP-dependent RNA helicase DHX15/PRP43
MDDIYFMVGRVLYQDFVLPCTSRINIRTVTDIKGEWLVDIAPKYYDLSSFPPGESREALERLFARPGQLQGIS